MFLFKRKGIYYLEYFDELGNRKRRVSTKARLKPDALKFLTQFNQKLNERKKARYISIKDFRQEYIAYLEQAHTKGYINLAKTAFKVLVNYTGNIPLTKLNNRILDKFILENFNRTCYGARLYYINLNAAFNKAMVWGYLTENPLRQIKLPKIPKSIPTFISPTELNMIVQNTKHRDLRDIFLTGMHSGMRLSELINIKWSAINLKERTIIVHNTETFTTKSKMERIIPINDTLATVLNNRIPKVLNIKLDEYVFCKYPGVPYLKDYVSKSFKRVIRKLGLNEKYHFHLLRVSFGSHLLQKGIPISTISKLLGHSSISVTERHYTSLSIENLTDAVKTLDTQAVNLLNN